MTTSETEMIEQEVRREVERYGCVRPPWRFMNEHPYSIGWRMGDGEGHLMVFWAWWQSLDHTEASRIDWVRRWEPVPLWYPWCARLIWPELCDEPDQDDNADERAVEKLAALGIGSVTEWSDAERRAIEA